MPSFSKRSKERLKTCDIRLQLIMNKAIELYDFTVLEGYRDGITQNRYFKKGVSKLKFPKSRHNKKPSQAVDACPYPISWDKTERFYELAGVIKTIAADYKIPIIWGGDWKIFKDLAHYQLKF